jgi:hypothetical protein
VLSTSSAAECEALDVVWARRQIDSAVTAAGETVATLWDEVGPPPPLPSLLRLLSLRTLQGMHTSAMGVRVCHLAAAQCIQAAMSGYHRPSRS